MQDPRILGAAAVSLYPFQGWLIPRLQRKVNQLGKQRVRAMRQISTCKSASRFPACRRSMPTILPPGIWPISPTAMATSMISALRFSAQVFHQVSEQLHQPADAVFLLCDRWLSGDQGQPVVRRAGGGAGGIQGHVVAVEGAARLLSTKGRLADQVRADHRAVSARWPAPAPDLLLAEPENIPHLQGELSVNNLSLAEDDRSRVMDSVSCSRCGSTNTSR